MRNGKVMWIAVVVVAASVGAVSVGMLLLGKSGSPAPSKSSIGVSATELQSNKDTDARQVSAGEASADWRAYSGTLSQVSPRLAGKTIDFRYPASWGDVKIEQTFEGTAFEGSDEKTYQVVDLTFSSYPVDGDGNGAHIKVVDSKDYAASNDISFLQRIMSGAGPLVKSDADALQKLGHGYGSTVFFGVNIAKKFAPRYFVASDESAKGVSFFLDDSQGAGINASFNPTMLNDGVGVVYGGSFPLRASQLDRLGEKLNSIDLANETTVGKWQAEKEALLSGSYDSNPDYMSIVHDAELVMKSVSIR